MNKISNRLTRNLLGLLGTCVLAAGGTGCGDFLDVMPDNVANMDHVFANKNEAENYLATLYSVSYTHLDVYKRQEPGLSAN